MQTNQMQIPSTLGLANPNINLNSTTLANDTNISQSNQQHLQQTLHSPNSQQSPQVQVRNRLPWRIIPFVVPFNVKCVFFFGIAATPCV